MIEILNDWKFWGFAIQICVTLLCFIVIKYNDFKHLSEDVQDLSTEVKANTKKLNKIDKTLAVQKQRIDDLK